MQEPFPSEEEFNIVNRELFELIYYCKSCKQTYNQMPRMPCWHCKSVDIWEKGLERVTVEKRFDRPTS